MLLNLAEFRGLHPESTLDDEPLQMLLDAAEAEIVRYAGPAGTRTELFTGGGRLLALRGQATSVTSVIETNTASGVAYDPLATDDYLLWPSGAVLERVAGGTTSRRTFRGRVEVVYVSVDEAALRKVVQSDLVALMETFRPGTSIETVGSWTRQMAANSAWNNSEERGMILARLHEEGRMAVVQ